MSSDDSDRRPQPRRAGGGRHRVAGGNPGATPRSIASGSATQTGSPDENRNPSPPSRRAAGEIQPHLITKPIQLLAAWLLGLVLLDSSFFTAAATMHTPAWAPGLLVIAAVGNVPLFAACLFALQTRYRPQMQEDAYYAQYLESQTRLVERSQLVVRETLASAGLDLERLANGRTIVDAAREDAPKLSTAVDGMRRGVDELRGQHGARYERIHPDWSLDLAKGLMAEGRWAEAGAYFDQYVSAMPGGPSDWRVHYTRGVAHANSRSGLVGDQAAVRAYSDAITLAPADLDADLRARLFAYRGAILKRLGRLDEAESDLLLARTLATSEEMIADIAYNLACIYAMRADRQKLFTELTRLTGDRVYLAAIWSHLTDYFAEFQDDPEFLSRIGARQ